VTRKKKLNTTDNRQYNYTLNPDGIFNAIKYMYTYYPDPNNRSHIREEFINVSSVCPKRE
jgi:hypothetical protein